MFDARRGVAKRRSLGQRDPKRVRANSNATAPMSQTGARLEVAGRVASAAAGADCSTHNNDWRGRKGRRAILMRSRLQLVVGSPDLELAVGSLAPRGAQTAWNVRVSTPESRHPRRRVCARELHSQSRPPAAGRRLQKWRRRAARCRFTHTGESEINEERSARGKGKRRRSLRTQQTKTFTRFCWLKRSQE